MRLLVIGYGNEFRGDDGAGPFVARQAASWRIPGATVVVSHGLLPELAEALSRAERAVFVDARVSGRVQVTELCPGPPALLGHCGGPDWLLALAEAAYGRRPRAWLVTVPAREFGHGEGLSEQTAAAAVEALEEVRRCMKLA